MRNNCPSGINPGLILNFLGLATGWLLIAGLICWIRSDDPETRRVSLSWLAIFWAVSVLDLLALGKTMASVMSLVHMTGEKRAAGTIRTLYWGTVKLACIGIFIVLLIKASATQQSGLNSGLLTGLGTMVVVPLIGGLLWSQRVLQHAR